MEDKILTQYAYTSSQILQTGIYFHHHNNKYIDLS
jgi:hypothetical protein